jgi:hypothetical protein
MHPETDDQAIQADTYIEALLSGHRREPVAVPADEGGAGPLARQPGVRDAIRLLEKGLPRFHPSFLFEEQLAEQLGRQAVATSGSAAKPTGKVVPIAVIHPTNAGARGADRRLLVGGAAIASGVSIGAAVIAWRRTRA